jgi:4-hydroxybenzoate polyprenyltransferase
MINDKYLMFEKKNSYLKTLHYLSFDVVLGAVASSWMFWKIPDGNVVINLPSILILGICTWIIYIFDRLLDNLKSEPEDARHKFHYRHQYYLQVGIFILFFIAAIIAFFLPRNIIYFGILLSILILIYFYILQKKSKLAYFQYFKEIFTSAIYSICVVGSAFSTKPNLNWEAYLAGFIFFLLVHQSILIFSFYESQAYPKTKNLAKKFGKTNCTYLILGVLALTAIANFLTDNFFLQKVFFIESLMAFFSVLIYFYQKKLAKNENYRWLGELVFWLPMILIFF